MATLYFATNGHEWKNSTIWLNYSVHELNVTGTPNKIFSVCPGFLSGFFNLTDPPPTTKCNQNGFYQHLWLDRNNLVGALPEELYMLTSVRTMPFGFNALTEAVSTRIGLLRSLEGPAVFFTAGTGGSAGVGGSIPTEIGLLTNLRVLYTGANNAHTGSIASEIWNLRKLEHVFLGRNPGLQGTIPTEIGTFQNLQWLVIDETLLSGKLCQVLFAFAHC